MSSFPQEVLQLVNRFIKYKRTFGILSDSEEDFKKDIDLFIIKGPEVPYQYILSKERRGKENSLFKWTKVEGPEQMQLHFSSTVRNELIIVDKGNLSSFPPRGNTNEHSCSKYAKRTLAYFQIPERISKQI